MEIKKYSDVIYETILKENEYNQSLIDKFNKKYDNIKLTKDGGIIKEFSNYLDCRKVVELLSDDFKENGWILDIVARVESWWSMSAKSEHTRTCYDIHIKPASNPKTTDG